MQTDILTKPVEGPAAWVAKDYANDDSWIHHFSQLELDELHGAMTSLSVEQVTSLQFGPEDFPLSRLTSVLEAAKHELENGRGFILFRGLSVPKYSEQALQAIYYGIGLHMGTPVGQNPRGDLLGAVENVGDPKDKHTRVYETNNTLPFHSDPSDVVALLCLRKAKAGGLSSLVSVASIYNAILAKHPEFLGLYYKAYYYAHLCEDLPSLSPLFSYYDGKLSCRYLRQYIELGADIMEQPLSNIERQALDVFDEAMQAPELRLDMMLEPGDMQFANNYMVLHSRTGFEDHAEPQCRRKLYRLWLKMPNARTLAPDFPGRNGFPLP